jgi:transposase
MTQEEELQALREENRSLKALVAELLPLKAQLAEANARNKELEERLAKDSRTSSKPPSSDGLARLPRRSRRPSGKRPGGQAGHAGHTLALVEPPDEVVPHHPTVCRQCHEDLSTVPGRVAERRQVLDVPAIRLLAQEHQLEAICCHTVTPPTSGAFPRQSARRCNMVPTCKRWPCICTRGNCSQQRAEATVLQWSELAAERLVANQLQHGDETGIRVYGMLHWLHVNCTRAPFPSGLACLARPRGHGRDRHLATLYRARHARPTGEL